MPTVCVQYTVTLSHRDETQCWEGDLLDAQGCLIAQATSPSLYTVWDMLQGIIADRVDEIMEQRS